MSGIITVARESLLKTNPIDWKLLAISFGISIILLFIGIIYFRKTERFFADIL
jgi:lipopolysaccharide transport system permease protein